MLIHEINRIVTAVKPISAKILLKSSGGPLLLQVKSTNVTSGVREGSFRQSQIWYGTTIRATFFKVEFIILEESLQIILLLQIFRNTGFYCR